MRPLWLVAAVLLAATVPLNADEPAPLDEARGEVALLGRALESYPSPSDFVKIRAALFSVSGEAARPHFETREKALRSVYRTLAAVDYTRARVLPAKCSPEERRAAILRHDDGLLAGPDGKLTPWFAAVLGLERAGEAPKEITAAASVADRAKALARVEELSKTLSAEGLEPTARAEALCERAGLYESLAVTSTGEIEASAPIEAGFSVPPVTGRCAAFCSGPPQPSYSGGGSSGYSTTWGPVLGQAIGNLIGQGIRKLFEPRPPRATPQQSYSRTVPREQSKAIYEPPPPPPEPPLKPSGLTLTATPSPAEEGVDITLSAAMSFTGKAGTKAGIPVSLELDNEDRLEVTSRSSRTNSDGIATFVVRAKPELAKQKLELTRHHTNRAQDALAAEARKVRAEESEEPSSVDQPEEAEASDDLSQPRFILNASARGAGFSAESRVPILPKQYKDRRPVPKYRIEITQGSESDSITRITAKVVRGSGNFRIDAQPLHFRIAGPDGNAIDLNATTDESGVATIFAAAIPQAQEVIAAGRTVGLIEAKASSVPRNTLCAAAGATLVFAITVSLGPVSVATEIAVATGMDAAFIGAGAGAGAGAAACAMFDNALEGIQAALASSRNDQKKSANRPEVQGQAADPNQVPPDDDDKKTDERDKKAKKRSTAGNMQTQVERNQAPKSVDRVDRARFTHEKDQVHFKDGNALNFDGTWKHGGRLLTRTEEEWLLKNGWSLPQ